MEVTLPPLTPAGRLPGRRISQAG